MSYTELILNESELPPNSNKTFTFKKDLEIEYFKVLSVYSPVYSYSINQTNNTLFLTEQDGIQKTISITPSNYNFASLSAELGSDLTNASNSNQTYNVSYDISSSTINITAPNGFKLQSSTAYWMNLPSVSQNYVTSITSGIADLSVSHPYLLCTNSLSFSTIYQNKVGINEQVLLCLPNVNNNNFISYQASNTGYMYSSTTTNTLQFRLIDSVTKQDINTNNGLVISLGILNNMTNEPNY